MNSSNQPNFTEPSSNTDRYHYFESIWDQTSGTNFDKTLAILDNYSSIDTSGSHVQSIKKAFQVYRKTDGYIEEVEKKNALIFNMGFLLFLINEKIPFNTINPSDDLHYAI